MQYFDYLQQYFSSKRGYYSLLALIAVLIILVIYTVFAQIKPIFWENNNNLGANKAINPSILKNTVISPQQLTSYHLFGEAPESIEKLIASDIKLTGIFMASDPSKTSAVLIIKNNPQAVFFVGDKITNGNTVEKILVDRVIINRNGRLHALFLPEDKEKNDNATEATNVESRPDLDLGSNPNVNRDALINGFNPTQQIELNKYLRDQKLDTRERR